MSIRKSANAGINAGMLVFIGSMFVGIVNKFLDEWAVTVEKAPAKPNDQDTTVG